MKHTWLLRNAHVLCGAPCLRERETLRHQLPEGPVPTISPSPRRLTVSPPSMVVEEVSSDPVPHFRTVLYP